MIFSAVPYSFPAAVQSLFVLSAAAPAPGISSAFPVFPGSEVPVSHISDLHLYIFPPLPMLS